MLEPFEVVGAILMFLAGASGWFGLGVMYARHRPHPDSPPPTLAPPSLDAFAVIERLNEDGEVIAFKEANSALKMTAIVKSERMCNQYGRLIQDGKVVATWKPSYPALEA